MKNPPVYILLSDHSQKTGLANYGVQLAKQTSATAHLLGIDQVPSVDAPAAIIGTGIPSPVRLDVEAMRQRVTKNLNDLKKNLVATYPHIKIDPIIDMPEVKLYDLIKVEQPQLLLLERDADLNTFNEWFGTFETRIAQRADCPVLILAKGWTWQPITKLLYLMDADDASAENMLKLTRLSENLHAHLQVVMLTEQKNDSTKEQAALKMVQVFRDVLGHEDVTFHRVAAEKKAEEVRELVAETRPDWLAFEQKQTSFFERMFNDYNTKRLILQSEIPVLVF